MDSMQQIIYINKKRRGPRHESWGTSTYIFSPRDPTELFSFVQLWFKPCEFSLSNTIIFAKNLLLESWNQQYQILKNKLVGLNFIDLNNFKMKVRPTGLPRLCPLYQSSVLLINGYNGMMALIGSLARWKQIVTYNILVHLNWYEFFKSLVMTGKTDMGR